MPFSRDQLGTLISPRESHMSNVLRNASFAILVSLFSLTFNYAIAQDEQQKTLKSFQRIAGNFSSFFKTKQRLLYKQTYSQSMTRILYYVVEYTSQKMSYDVQKTQSLVSPFVGFIYLELISRDNGSCGDVQGYKGKVGWDNATAALRFADKPQCYKYITGKPWVDPVRLTFAFHDGRWIFQNAVRTEYHNRPEIPISAALGVEAEPGRVITEKDGKAFNRPWLDLIENQ